MTSPALLLWMAVAIPVLSAVLLAAVPRPRAAALGGVAATAAGLLCALVLSVVPRDAAGTLAGGLLRGDALSLWLLVVGGGVGLAASLHAAALPAKAFGRVEARVHRVSLQLLLAAQHLSLLADDALLGWTALLCGTLATLPPLVLRRTPAAMEAAWGTLLSCGAGLVLALFGTALLVLAVQPDAGPSGWAAMVLLAPRASPDLLGLGFVFLLVGHGALAGLVPAHGWLRAVQSEGTAAGTALSTLLALGALHAVLRARLVLLGAPDAPPPDQVMLVLGGLSFAAAALSSLRGDGLGRLLAWTGTGHAGLVLMCFGVGAPLAGILHLSAQLLLRTAALFALDRALMGREGWKMSLPPGLVFSRPGLSWALSLALAGLAGLPPSGLFASELALMLATARGTPWMLLLLCLGLTLLAARLLGALRQARGGSPAPDEPADRVLAAGMRTSDLAIWGCLAAVLMLGITTPSLLLQAAAVAGR